VDRTRLRPVEWREGSEAAPPRVGPEDEQEISAS
jgi:hypothetical protein